MRPAVRGVGREEDRFVLRVVPDEVGSALPADRMRPRGAAAVYKARFSEVRHVLRRTGSDSGDGDGAFMEPSGRNQWQPVAKARAPKSALTSQNRCRRLRPVAARSAWYGGGRRFESVRGLRGNACKSTVRFLETANDCHTRALRARSILRMRSHGRSASGLFEPFRRPLGSLRQEGWIVEEVSRPAQFRHGVSIDLSPGLRRPICAA
jgi:hypothetical protein